MQSISHSLRQRIYFWEQLLNSLTHGLGALLGVVGLIVMMVCAVRYGDAWHIATSAVFGGSVILLYSSSTLLHLFPERTFTSHLEKLDHICIYFLIAGTYTPFALVNMRGIWGWMLFGLIWALTLSGTVAKLFFFKKINNLSTWLYLLMGWSIILTLKPAIESISFNGLMLLVGGGLAYTVGVIFFVLDKKIPFGHAVWHVFVLVGTSLHYFAIFYHVIPSPVSS